jgi:hypothetical protein
MGRIGTATDVEPFVPVPATFAPSDFQPCPNSYTETRLPLPGQNDVGTSSDAQFMESVALLPN